MKALHFNKDTLLYARSEENNSIYVIPPLKQPKEFKGTNMLWAMEADESKTFLIRTNGEYCVKKEKTALLFFSIINSI